MIKPGELPGLRDISPFWPDRLTDLWPGREALIEPDRNRRHTFRDLRDRALRSAARLASSGVGQGDRVATLMHNSVQSLDLFFACGKLGAIFVPLNWRLSARELSQMIEDTTPTVLIAHAEYSQLADACRGTTPLTVVGDEEEYADDSRDVPRVEVRMPDPWMILFTGGTTGIPKGAVLTHGSVTWNAINTAVSWGLSEADSGPVFTPIFHTGGLNVFTLPMLMLGAKVILPERFDPAQVLDIVRTERPTMFFAVPTMFQMIAEQPGFESADFSSLRCALSGGAPLPDRIARLWASKVRVFKQGYGLTEAGPNNFATSDEDALQRKQMSVGKLTFFVSARIVDDLGRDVEDGTPGELLLAGPHLCAGYWNRPEATAEAIRDGWLHTGDIARRDNQGFYYIVDRKKDMIITGGENVFPTEVEGVLYTHTAVREAAVVGLPDPVWGEAICAVVSLKSGRQATPEEIREHTRLNLARYKAPKRVVIVDDLPKNAAGKIVRAEAKKLVTIGEI